MKKQTTFAPKQKTVAEQFIDHLKGEVAELRAQNQFLVGKVERLELSLMDFKSEPAQVYVTRTDHAARPKITEIPVDKRPPERKDFPAIKRQWEDMTQQEQEKAVEDGLEVLSP